MMERLFVDRAEKQYKRSKCLSFEIYQLVIGI